jgi:hypothetical protein
MHGLAKSPYLENPARLGDVIAAIQAMGTYKFYKMSFEGWADRITGDGSQADYWKRIFQEHPEFFRLDSAREKASLVWRRQYAKHYDVDSETKISTAEFEALPSDRKNRVSRDPLSPADIKTLIDTAINMHSRAVELQRERGWWKSPLLSAIAALIGAAAGALIKH